MSLVPDSSVTLSGCFDDERTDATDALLKQVVESGAEAPSLWPLEIFDALSMADRRRRIDTERRQRLSGFLHDRPCARWVVHWASPCGRGRSRSRAAPPIDAR